MNVIVQADHIIPEEMAKIQNQVESRTVKTEMITNETTYSITSKISTTQKQSLGLVADDPKAIPTPVMADV